MDRGFWRGLIKDWGIALAVAVVVFVGWSLLRPSVPSSGSAPIFTLKDLDGAEVRLADLQGAVVVLNFWATWCGPCRAEIPELSAFAQAHPDVILLGISVDERLTAPAVKRHAERLGVTYRVLHDPNGDASDLYRVHTLPTTVVIDAEGNIQATHMGTVTKRGLERMVFRP